MKGIDKESKPLTFYVMQLDNWNLWTITWRKAEGLRVYLNAAFANIKGDHAIAFPREREHIDHMMVGKYASALRKDSVANGSFTYGHVAFAGLFYVPLALPFEQIRRHLGLIGSLQITPNEDFHLPRASFIDN